MRCELGILDDCESSMHYFSLGGITDPRITCCDPQQGGRGPSWRFLVVCPQYEGTRGEAVKCMRMLAGRFKAVYRLGSDELVTAFSMHCAMGALHKCRGRVRLG